ncbi:SMP-30/gluconolactonase/LRE family protein [Hymenobacter crusticola]|uniref:Gluconolactonase n=1 Tax=Hymenobacter crusticola TaxID=1770526 RepID=A0A243WI31_9BACT|nr:SMP-30/gluconolactonase/LRE family protein [Hymenobacter crusticola]OUJ74669.1 gluconolactonase [Hymenobacter crusticola]
MRVIALFISFLLCVVAGPGYAQTASFTTTGRVVRQAPALDQVLAPDAKIEVVAAGFDHIEGPVWVSDSSMLLFSDTKEQTIYRWSAKNGLSKFLEQNGYTGRMPYSKEPGSNGLALDGRGNLLICEHGDRRVASLPLAGKSGKRTLSDNYQGKRYNSPNDVLAHPTTAHIYFTDPPFGLPKQDKDPLREISVSGVYRLAPDGKVTQEITELSKANGLAFTSDGRTLYVSNADSLRPVIMAYDVRSNGKLGAGRVFFDMSTLPKVRFKEVPDGLKVDRQGNVWAAGVGGVVVLSPQGQHLGTIDTGEVVANCAWGDDGHTLYLASGSWLCRIKTLTQGVMRTP